jgi:hypothetical protein
MQVVCVTTVGIYVIEADDLKVNGVPAGDLVAGRSGKSLIHRCGYSRCDKWVIGQACCDDPSHPVMASRERKEGTIKRAKEE